MVNYKLRGISVHREVESEGSQRQSFCFLESMPEKMYNYSDRGDDMKLVIEITSCIA